MKSFILASLVLVLLGTGQHNLIIHPTIKATVDSELTSEFMNGIEAHCPDGYKFKNDNIGPGGSYKDTFNQVASAVCVAK